MTATNAGGSASATSAATAVVTAPAPPPPPANTAVPSVTGTTTQGQTLTTTNGSWSNSPNSYKYAWRDCSTSGGSCSNISGATASTYTLAATDVGHTIKSVVTATNAGGSGSGTSAATAVVAAPAPPPPPANNAAPAVTGTTTQGQTLTTTNGSWSNSPTSFKYAWQDCDGSGANCTNISGATASTYTLAASDVGHTIKAVVTATNSGGSNSAASSSVGPVSAPSSSGPCPVSTPNVPDGPDPWGGCFPGPKTTGVPAGTVLTNYTGPCTVTTANTIITAKTINCDPLTVEAANVQVSDSLINGSIHNDDTYPDPYSFTITDSEINTPTNRAELQNGVRSIEKYNFTAIGVNAHGGISGAFCEDNCTIKDSYLWGQGNDNNGSNTCVANDGTKHVCIHESALRDGESSDATKGQLIQHNSLWCSANQYEDPNSGGSDSSGCSADLTGYGDFAPIQNNTLKNNLFVATGTGGTCAYGGSSTGKPYSNNANHDVFQNNVFQHSNANQDSGHCGVWFASADFSTSAPGNSWSGNTWENGAALPANQ